MRTYKINPISISHTWWPWRLAVARAAILQLLLLAPLQAEQDKTTNQQRSFTDKDVTSAVEERFLFDNALPWAFVDVKTHDGIVTLSGTTDNLLAKERATKIAESTRGVRAVVNLLQVQIRPRSDDEILKDVDNALLTDAATDSYEVKTMVNKGSVTLAGTVQSFQEKKLAEHLAKSIRGVKEVENNLAVRYESSRPDAEIAADAKRALETDVWVDASQVNVNANNGKVTLTGKVGSAAEKDRAQTLAWVMGVSAVDAEGIEVDPILAHNIRQPGMNVMTDKDIAKAVRAAFIYDPRVFSFNPDIDVHNGVVTLSGVVNNLKAKQAAERDARNTVGVYSVRNHLKARPVNPPSDAKLTQNVKDALQRDVIVDASEINPVAYNGTVTLSGKVISNYEKSRAEDVAYRLNGVVRVNNQLEVKQPALASENMWWDPYYAYLPYYRYWPITASRSDQEIKDHIKDELFWSPFVDADQVHVSVDNGVATLTGTVDRWSELSVATENAREGGAIRVVNKLAVDQGS